jgi:hypothetical protein
MTTRIPADSDRVIRGEDPSAAAAEKGSGASA